MLDPTFNPYDAMLTLNENQQLLVERQKSQAQEIKDLMIMVNEQQNQIDVIVKGLEQANRLNTQLMEKLLLEINKNINTYSTQGNH